MEHYSKKATEQCDERANGQPHIPVRLPFDGYANDPNAVVCSQCRKRLGSAA